jgi:hypothetical protein
LQIESSHEEPSISRSAAVKKSPILAAILNFFLFGAGTLYVGRRVPLGLGLTVGGTMAQAAEIIISPPVRNLAPSIWPLLISGLVIMKITLAIDAYREAKDAS